MNKVDQVDQAIEELTGLEASAGEKPDDRVESSEENAIAYKVM